MLKKKTPMKNCRVGVDNFYFYNFCCKLITIANDLWSSRDPMFFLSFSETACDEISNVAEDLAELIKVKYR